jgi:hypothetical protein
LTKLSLKSTGDDSHRSFYRHSIKDCIGAWKQQSQLVALASSLRRNTRVESLDLAGNNIGGKGAITLANAFRGDTTLKTIAKFERQSYRR